MTALEQKIFLTLVSNITPEDEDFKEYSIAIKEFIGLLKSKHQTKIYNDIHEASRKLMSKILTIETESTIVTTALLSSVETPKGKGIMKIRFNPFLKPYLIDIKTRFTKYQLKNIITLKSSHSIRIYELLKQYQKIKKRKFELDELKSFLGLENKYKVFKDFEKNVLQVAEREINNQTDLKISYEKIKIGRKIGEIVFHIELSQRDVESETINQYREKKIFDFDKIKELARLNDAMFSDKQILELYEIACDVVDRLSAIEYNVDIYRYMELNYKYSKINSNQSLYAYYKKALKEDFASAKIAMMK